MPNNFLTELTSLFPADQVSVEAEVLSKHSHDASTHPAYPPDVVIWPLTTQDVVKVVKLANDQSIPVTVCGARTGLEGNALPVNGGIVLDMTQMNQMLEVKPNDFQVTVQPGIVGAELNQQLAPYSLQFPAFPASANTATLGGMIANNAGGMYAVKYGVVGNWVMALEVVMADGQIIHVGSHSIKSVAGYDLKSLLIGSEGTLGIITQATLKLVPVPKATYLVAVSFPAIRIALEATLALLNEQVDPVAMEMLDSATIQYLNGFKKTDWLEQPTLLIEVQGADEEVKIRGLKIQDICHAHGCTSIKTANTSESVAAIWDVRKAAYPAMVAAHPDSGILPGDVGLPLSQIPSYINFVSELGQEYELPVPTFGHIGDGNFHFWLVYKKDDPIEGAKAKDMAGRLVGKALELGGTCTAEHGVGIGKQVYLALEHSDSLYLMKLIKQTLDPKGILNPGKIFQSP